MISLSIEKKKHLECHHFPISPDTLRAHAYIIYYIVSFQGVCDRVVLVQLLITSLALTTAEEVDAR